MLNIDKFSPLKGCQLVQEKLVCYIDYLAMISHDQLNQSLDLV